MPLLPAPCKMYGSSFADKMAHRTSVGSTHLIDIQRLASDGQGVGNLGGLTLFVDGALPSEIVKVAIVESKKNYARGKLLAILKSSVDRVDPICPLFGSCGGCQLMHLAYEKQLESKRQKVIDALKRIGKIETPVLPCRASPLPIGYRNKIQLPVRPGPQGNAIGLYVKGSHDLIEVDHCFIHSDLGEKIYSAIRPLIKEGPVLPYDPQTGTGELCHVLIKNTHHTDQVLIALITKQKPSPPIRSLAETIFRQDPAIRGVVHNIQAKETNVILGSQGTVLIGSPTIEEEILGLRFSISAESFFQVNPKQAEQLYQKALELSCVRKTDTVLDAYCGVGTLCLLFAKQAKKTIGIECIPKAIQDARENGKRNGILNASFILGKAEQEIDQLRSIDIALINPPRKGADPLFLQKIIKKQIKTLLYISCDPATLARDLSLLKEAGYTIVHVEPFDMFPQTSHVETIVKLQKG